MKQLKYMNLKGIKNIIISFLITFSAFNIFNLQSGNIITLVIFVFTYLLLGSGINKDINNRRAEIISAILAITYSILYCMGSYKTIGGGMENSLFLAGYVIFTFTGLALFFYGTCVFILKRIDKIDLKKKTGEAYDRNNRIEDKYQGKLFFTYFLIVFLGILPMLLLNLPGILTIDSLDQLGQALGLKAMDDHHPFVHTLTMKAFGYPFYLLWGVNAYVFFAALMQMIIMSLSVAYSIVSLRLYGVNKKIRIALALIYILVPYNTLYAVTLWKDILFSAAVLTSTISLYRLMTEKTNNNKTRNMVIFAISSLGVCLYRHNGFYGYILLFGVFAVGILKDIKNKNVKQFKYITITGVIILLTIIINGPVRESLNVAPGLLPYKLAMPLQQLGRVVTEGKISENDLQLLGDINDVDYIRDNYIPEGADNMLQWAVFGNYNIIKEKSPEYLSLYLRVGLQNPKQYAEAFIDQTRGYFFPMNPQQTVNFAIPEDNEFGLESKPVIRGKVLIKINELITKVYDYFPVYGCFYSIGTNFWIFLLSIGIMVYKSNRKLLVSSVLLLGVHLTLFLAVPLAADLRYGYSLCLTLPYIFILSLADR